MRKSKNTILHATFVKVYEYGILLLGNSGFGKSECALELVSKKHLLIADDSVEIFKTNQNEIFGKANTFLKHLLHIRSIGILNIKELFGPEFICDEHKIDMIVEFVDEFKNLNSNIQLESLQKKILLGIPFPCLQIPVSTHMNRALLIEIAVKNEMRKMNGNNDAQLFLQKQKILCLSKKNNA